MSTLPSIFSRSLHRGTRSLVLLALMIVILSSPVHFLRGQDISPIPPLTTSPQPGNLRVTLPWGIVVSYPVEFIKDAGACISRNETTKLFQTLEPKSDITWDAAEGIYHVKLSQHLFTLYRDRNLIVFDNNIEQSLHPLQEKEGEIFIPLTSLKPLLTLIPGVGHNINAIMEYKTPPKVKEVTVVERKPAVAAMLPSARFKPITTDDLRAIEAAQSTYARETNLSRQVINDGLRRSINLMAGRRAIILDPQPYAVVQHSPTINNGHNEVIPDPPDLTLLIADRCRSILQRDGSLRVLLTREPGGAPAQPDERLRIANTANALGLVCLRLDFSPAFPANRGYRFHTAHQSVDTNAFQNLNRINTPDQLPVDGAYLPHEEMSLFLIRLLDRGLDKVGIPPAPLKSKPAPFYVLKRAAMPSLSITLGFWSNTSDRLRMAERNYVETMAQNLAQNLLLYSRWVGEMSREVQR